MFRAVLTVLLALPMLVPPGMCVCQFVPCGHVRAGTTVSAPTQVDVPVASGRCCRCASKSTRNERVEPTQLAGTRHVEPRVPTPGPADHMPGCPASVEAAVRNVSHVADPVPSLGLPSVAWLSRPAAPVDSQRLNDRWIVINQATPLFLAHRALLI